MISLKGAAYSRRQLPGTSPLVCTTDFRQNLNSHEQNFRSSDLSKEFKLSGLKEHVSGACHLKLFFPLVCTVCICMYVCMYVGEIKTIKTKSGSSCNTSPLTLLLFLHQLKLNQLFYTEYAIKKQWP